MSDRLKEALQRMQDADAEYQRLQPSGERPLTSQQRSVAEDLGYRWLDVATVLIEREHVGAIRSTDEATHYFELAESSTGQAIAARNMSRAWLEAMPPHPEAWAAAEAAAQRSYELCLVDDAEGRARARAQLGLVWLARAKAALDPEVVAHDAGRAVDELTAGRDVLTTGAFAASLDNNLGAAFTMVGDSTRALQAFLSSIQGYQRAGENLLAAEVQQNYAAALLESGRFDDVRDALAAARRTFVAEAETDRVQVVDQFVSLVDQFQAHWPRND
jgi:tetratricopeptide (TPR) repeat protein